MHVLVDPSYQVVRKLKAGAFGVVFKAIDGRTGQTVALKKIRCENADAVLSCVKETKTQQALQHPNIVRSLDAFLVERNGTAKVMIAMEFCGGGDLDDFITSLNGN